MVEANNRLPVARARADPITQATFKTVAHVVVVVGDTAVVAVAMSAAAEEEAPAAKATIPVVAMADAAVTTAHQEAMLVVVLRHLVKAEPLLVAQDSTRIRAAKVVVVEVAVWALRAVVAAQWEAVCHLTEKEEMSSKALAGAVELVVVATKAVKLVVIRAKEAPLVDSKTTRQSCASTSTRGRHAPTLTTAHTLTVCTSFARRVPKPRVGRWAAAQACTRTKLNTSLS